ncbi:MAG: Gfo/Idh/MocA family oxidoreductase [Candidatus Aenigmatarchaeota archaeon]
MTGKIKIGVIGAAGFIGEVHTRAAFEIPNAKLVAIADINEERGKEVAKKYNTKWYKDYNDMLKKEDIDAVIIATPDDLHLDPAIAAAEAGKHMLIEKPLATNVKDAEEIIKYAKKNGVKLMVGHTLRFFPEYVAIKEMIERGEIGEIIQIWTRRNSRVDRARRLKGRVSSVFFFGIHDIDFIRWCVNDEIKRVYAVANKKLLKEINVEDTILALLKFKNGCIASLENCWVLPQAYPTWCDARIEIVGTKSAIFLNMMEQGLMIYNENIRQYIPSTIHKKFISPILYEDEHFINCLINNEEFIVTGEDGLIAVKIAEAIHKSINNEEVIIL